MSESLKTVEQLQRIGEKSVPRFVTAHQVPVLSRLSISCDWRTGTKDVNVPVTPDVVTHYKDLPSGTSYHKVERTIQSEQITINERNIQVEGCRFLVHQGILPDSDYKAKLLILLSDQGELLSARVSYTYHAHGREETLDLGDFEKRPDGKWKRTRIPKKTYAVRDENGKFIIVEKENPYVAVLVKSLMTEERMKALGSEVDGMVNTFKPSLSK